MEQSKDLYELIAGKRLGYTEASKRAQKKYRDKNKDKYNESQKALYNKLKENPEWKERFNERSRYHNQVYRDKKNSIDQRHKRIIKLYNRLINDVKQIKPIN